MLPTSTLCHLVYSQVVSHVYTTTFIHVKPHVMLSLILYKMVDEIAEVCGELAPHQCSKHLEAPSGRPLPSSSS